MLYNRFAVSVYDVFVCDRCTVGSVQKRRVAIARLRNPAFIGRTCQEVWFIILVVTSIKEASCCCR